MNCSPKDMRFQDMGASPLSNSDNTGGDAKTHPGGKLRTSFKWFSKAPDGQAKRGSFASATSLFGKISSKRPSKTTARNTTKTKSLSHAQRLFCIEGLEASADELNLEAVSDTELDDHVSLAWTKKDLTASARVFLESKGVDESALPERVYLGDRHLACDHAQLDKLEIEYIVNCTHSTPCRFQDEEDRFLYHRVPLSDDSFENLLEHIPNAIRFINEARLEDDEFQARSNHVLVHCSYGVSRSVSVVVAWMMITLGTSLRDALSLVSQRRAKAKPNLIFMKQLMKLEKEVFGADKVSLTESCFEPCIICLATSFTEDKRELKCGHEACGKCVEQGVEMCTHCEYSSIGRYQSFFGAKD